MSLSPLLDPLLGDGELAAFFTPGAEIAAMLGFEAALARIQARLGIVPGESAAAIDEAARTFRPDPALLAGAMARDGMPVPGLVALFRASLPAEHAQWLHWAATSQDVTDTGLALRLRDALGVLDRRLARLVAVLAAAADTHRGTVMAARTRSQIATPTTLGLRLAIWAEPLARHRARLAELRPRLLVVSSFGASGTLAASGGRGIATMEALAAELGLGAAVLPWHAARDTLAELAAWCGLVTGSLGKIGQDLLVLARSEIGELHAGESGGSSTMPHKANPVGAEVLLALARHSATLAAGAFHSLVHAEEREGAALMGEWLVLPDLMIATGAATRTALALVETLRPDPVRMAANMAATNGLMLAEAATFALSAHLPRPEAQALVKAACARAVTEGRGLADILGATTDAPVDWACVLDPAGYTGEAEVFIDRFLAALRPG